MADDSYDKMRKQFDEMKRQTKEMLDKQQELEKGLGGYVKVWEDIRQIQQDILHVQQEKAKAEKELADYEKSTAKKRERWMKLAASNNKKIAKAAQERLAAIDAELNTRKANVKILEEEGDQLKKNLDTTKKMVKESNALKAAFRSTGNFVKKWGWDKLKSYGVFEMDKEIRNAARSMGVGNKQFSQFSKNLEMAGKSTMTMGVNTKQLAKLQKGYSEEIGRTVRLTRGGLEAMAELTEGTGLGEQYAIGMAGAMDTFGANVETTRDLVEDTMKVAEGMGVNGAKAAKVLQQNLKFAQKYHFKGGVKALGKMSADALRLKLDMDGIAGVAEKVFRPEGAIEMAAQLSVMGGEFAKLGDPMQLMFKARNDFEGFAKDIGKATAEFVEYNKESGTFEIKGGLAADRMREISKMTGIGVEKLQEMAVQQKKIEAIGSVTPIGFSKEDQEFISSISEVGENGEIKINIGENKGKLVKDLTAMELEKIKAEKQNLDERAKQSRTAMEDLQDIKTSFQELLIPVAQALKKNLGDPLKKMLKDWNQPGGLYERIHDFVAGTANFITSIGKFGIKLASFLGPTGILATWGALKVGTWLLNGRMLGLGFNMTANVGGGSGSGGGGGIMDMFTGRGGRGGGGILSKMKAGKKVGGFKGMMTGMGRGLGMRGLGKNLATGKNSSYLKGFGKMGKLAKAGGALSLLSAGMDLYGNMTDDRLSTGDALLKTLDQNKFTAIGAALAPFTGGLSLLAGGAADYLVGASGNYGEQISSSGGPGMNYGMNDGIFSKGKSKIKFNPKDKFTSVDDGTFIAGTSEGGNGKLADQLKKSSSTVHHKHDEVKIKLSFEGLADDIAKRIIDEPELRRTINTVVNEETASVFSGGKKSPNPNFG